MYIKLIDIRCRFTQVIRMSSPVCTGWPAEAAYLILETAIANSFGSHLFFSKFKAIPFLRLILINLWMFFFSNWRSDERKRTRAVPHIKSYARISTVNPAKASWFVLTSANLSKVHVHMIKIVFPCRIILINEKISWFRPLGEWEPTREHRLWSSHLKSASFSSRNSLWVLL